MKKWHIAAVILVVLFAAAGCVLTAVGIHGKTELAASVTAEPKQLETVEVDPGPVHTYYVPREEMLARFAEIIYTYDTRERLFYEGAQTYMTEAGYRMLVPFSAGEELEDKEENRPAAVISTLNEVSFYYKELEAGSAIVMMEAGFALARSGNGEILQYTKLSIKETKDGWKIDAYEPVDTIER